MASKLFSVALAFGCGVALVAGLPASPAAAQVLASGQFELQAATEVDPAAVGFNDAFTFRHPVPPGLGPTAGHQLVVRLRDVGRPRQTCGSDHPASGCATVDWALPGQVFRNLVELPTTNGRILLHMRLDGSLGSDPEPAHPE